MESEPNSTPLKLSYFSFPSDFPEPPGMLTPPLRRPVSVPFLWEEAPGKPRTFDGETTAGGGVARCLELPPRLVSDVKITNTPSSPKTGLEGAFVRRSASCSVSWSRSKRLPSFESSSHQSKKKEGRPSSFGSWVRRGLKGNRRVGEDSCVVSPTCSSSSSSSSSATSSSTCSYSSDSGGGDTKVKMTRSGSLNVLTLSSTRSHVWASIRGSLMPWRKNSNKTMN